MAALDKKYYFKKTREGRRAGILMPISSLPSDYGIGTMGEAARDFVDFLAIAGQTIWQVLPIGITGFGDSPYQSFSTHMGNPYFIDLTILVEEGLLERESLDQLNFGDDPSRVDYGKLWETRYVILRWAFDTYKYDPPKGMPEAFEEFKKKMTWLHDDALFMAIKQVQNGAAWTDWPEPLKRRDRVALVQFEEAENDRIEFQKFMQFLFYRQWRALKAYANSKGVSILGDLPIYVAMDSVEVWKEPHLFQLDEELRPTFVAGCPPDYFSADGQLWGNPLYDWDQMVEEDYAWWVERIAFALKLFDAVRIDHFRGFESYWAVPYGDATARRGNWLPGPAEELFDTVKEELGELPIVAEDLGYMTEEVHAFREHCGFPSMKVLQFAFSPRADSDYLPHNMIENAVVYTGTHDNDTLEGWLSVAPKEEVEFAAKYLGLSAEEGYRWGMIRGAYTTIARTVILQAQDLLGLDNAARMNAPGQAEGNWQWRMLPDKLELWIAERLREFCRMSGRLPEMPSDEEDEEEETEAKEPVEKDS